MGRSMDFGGYTEQGQDDARSSSPGSNIIQSYESKISGQNSNQDDNKSSAGGNAGKSAAVSAIFA